MANPFDALNQGLERLSTSPLGMAGLGLLMQPSQSLTPINPWEYAARGMQMGIQNKRTQQEAMQRQQLLQQEEQRRRMQYLMDIQRYQQEQIKSQQAEQQRRQQEEAMNAAIGNLTPEQQAMARAIGPSYLRDMARNAMKPPQQTNLERNLIAAGLQPGTPAFQDAIMKGVMTPRVQIGGPVDKPLSVSDVTKLRDPSGKPIPYGVTPEQAQQMGATTVDPIQQAQEMQKVKEEAERRAKAPAIQSFNMLADEMVGTEKNPGAIDRVTTGGPLGAYGFLSRGLDPSDVQNFESIVSTMSTQLRSILRIPGEGTLTDQEQRQYGLTLPSISNSPDVNKAIINRLKAILKTRGGMPATSIQDQADAILRGEM